MKYKSFKTFLKVAACCLLLSACGKDDRSMLLHRSAEKYAHLTVVDIHNHDADGLRFLKSEKIWDSYGIDKIVLFGNISEPEALTSDQTAYAAYLNQKERYFPFIAGLNIHDSSCVEYVRESFERGFFGIGEVVAASTYSPVTSNLAWKGDHPMDGFFPEVYELCAEYGRPILLHIDPPTGYPISKLEEAATKYPDTKFIFAHANAYNSPVNIEILLEKHENIYVDFFAGFTAYNKDSDFELSDFVPLIKKFPDQFMVSSDSGYDLDYDLAYQAIYELFDMLPEEIVIKIAGQNFLNLIGLF